MKTIENWEVVEIIDGIEKVAIPLPGCIIKGEIDGELFNIETSDIDMSRLTIVDTKGEKYFLGGARAQYKNLLNDVMEYAMGKDTKER